MFFAFFILTRLLFITGMVFIIGYIFGSFSKNKTLTRITKISTILIIVLSILTGAFFARSGGRVPGKSYYKSHSCHVSPADSTWTK